MPQQMQQHIQPEIYNHIPLIVSQSLQKMKQEAVKRQIQEHVIQVNTVFQRKSMCFGVVLQFYAA